MSVCTPASLHQTLDAHLHLLRSKTGAPNLGVALLWQGEQLCLHSGHRDVGGAIPVTAATRYPTRGFSQCLVRAALLDQVHVRGVALDTTLATLLPALACAQAERIRLCDLLAFGSGIQEDNLADFDVLLGYDREAFARHFTARELLFVPGSCFNPIYTDTVLLAQVLEALTAEPWDHLVGQQLQRLGIDVDATREADVELHQFDLSIKAFRTAELPDWGEFWQPAVGGPALTLQELLTLARACLSSDDSLRHWQALYRPTRLTLPRAWMGPRADVCPVSSASGFVGYANGSHGPFAYGSGECFSLRLWPEHQAAAVVTCSWDQPQIRNLVLQRIEQELGLGRSRSDSAVIEPGLPIDALPGEYRGRQFSSLHVTREADTLCVRPGENPCLPAAYNDYCIRLDIRGDTLVPVSGIADSCLGFFRDPHSARPCLMKGMNVHVHTGAA